MQIFNVRSKIKNKMKQKQLKQKSLSVRNPKNGHRVREVRRGVNSLWRKRYMEKIILLWSGRENGWWIWEWWWRRRFSRLSSMYINAPVAHAAVDLQELCSAPLECVRTSTVAVCIDRMRPSASTTAMSTGQCVPHRRRKLFTPPQ